jgi:CheY-like chemotaxis protein
MPAKKPAERGSINAGAEKRHVRRGEKAPRNGRASIRERPKSIQLRQRPLSVLIVDDDVVATKSLAEVLRAKGFEVRAATSGPNALVQVKDWQPDVALLDLMMPGMDGFELAGRLCEDSKHRPVLIAITGLGNMPVRERTLAAGFERHLLKPINLSVLTKLLRHFAAVKRG